jgi:hypothetical protein
MVYVLRGSDAYDDTVEIVPGEKVRFGIAKNVILMGSTKAFPLDRPLPGIRWSIEPAGRGVAIAADGAVTAGSDARPGPYRVVASANGETRSKELQVYRPFEQRLVGEWREIAQVECGTATEVSPRMPIRELIFRAGGQFSVTWFPFETRKDYWGTYEYDAASGALTLKPDNKYNNVPPDLHPAGKARVDSGGRLVVGGGLWLGTLGNGGAQPPEAAKGVCGQVFRR